MHRIFSDRIAKSSSRRDPPSFLVSLVAVTNTPSDVTTTTTTTTTKDIDETSITSGKKAQGPDGASSGSADPATATPRSPHANQLISFYTDPNGGRDSRDRTLSEILRFSNDQLEYHHDYIQWLFPLPEPSPYNWHAPKIDQATAQAFRTHVELRDRLRKSLVRMLSFYGFEVVPVPAAAAAGGQFGIQERLGFPRESAFWIRSFDHNHLRITRIIRCLRVLGLDEEAKEFYKALVRAAAPRPGRNRCVSPRTLMFWKRAAKRPLQVPPEAENYADEEEEEEEEEGDGSGDDNESENNL